TPSRRSARRAMPADLSPLTLRVSRSARLAVLLTRALLASVALVPRPLPAGSERPRQPLGPGQGPGRGRGGGRGRGRVAGARIRERAKRQPRRRFRWRWFAGFTFALRRGGRRRKAT